MTYLPIPEITETARGSTSTEHIWQHWQTARDYSENLYQAARDLLESVNNALENATAPVYDLQLAQSGIVGALPTAPEHDPVAVEPIPFTAEVPSFEAPAISTEPAPEISFTEPDFNMPEVPDTPFPLFDTEPPPISDVQLPGAPDVELPVIPNLAEVSIPAAPELNMPAFDGVFPTMDLTPPEYSFTWSEPGYTSTILTQLKDRLSTDLANGGTGLDAATEQAIYDRAISRQEAENEKFYNDTLNLFASRGFVLPPGALAGQLLEVSARINQTREDLNNDILIQQSKLAQENTQATIARSIEHERDLMGHFNRVQDRALDAAKTVGTMAIEVFKARVEAYRGQLQAYQVMAQVYESRIRAEVAKAEMYRAQIEGAKAQVELQMMFIEAYKAQVEGVKALMQLYATRMEAARIEADVNRTRIQSYAALVDAYKSRVQAVSARWDAYGAQIRGEEAKANMYGAQVQAYAARVGAYKAKADVDVSRAQIAVEILRGRSEVFKNQVQQYTAIVQAAVSQAEVKVKEAGLDVDRYKADIDRYNAEMQARVGEMNAIVREITAKIGHDAQVFEALQRYNTAIIETNSENRRIAAKVAGQQAAAFISTHTTSVTAGHRENRSDHTNRSSSVTSSSNSNASAHVGTYTHINKSG